MRNFINSIICKIGVMCMKRFFPHVDIHFTDGDERKREVLAIIFAAKRETLEMFCVRRNWRENN